MRRSERADTWLRQARQDLKVARANARDGFHAACAQLCQQAAEKAVKAVWMDASAAEPPQTHSVARLAIGLGAPQDIEDALNDLGGDYIMSRYPMYDDVAPYEAYVEDDAQDRLAKAEAVLAWASAQWEEDDAAQ
jgi:HEPN domain-containing protein